MTGRKRSKKQKHASLLTAERARELLTYNPETGELIWRVSKGRGLTGKVAGFVNKDGYAKVKIDDKAYFAHRLIWLIQTGKWPKEQIDHRDLNGANNRWKNLREANNAQNRVNAKLRPDNKSGFTGVTFKADRFRRRPWYASIGPSKSRVFLGYFATAEQAAEAVRVAHVKYFGEVSRL